MKRILTLLLLLAAATRLQAQNATIIKAGKLIDVANSRVLEAQQILVQDNKIVEVGSRVNAPAGATVIDLGNAWVLPGLIDCHVHITNENENYVDRFKKSHIDAAVSAHVYARRTLEAGFTTVRNVGAPEFVDVALRNAIRSGKVVGPRLFVSGLTLGSTGGHADFTGSSPYLNPDRFTGVANGEDEIRAKVRFNIKYGADLIKFCATAGVLSEEESVGLPQYTQQEMNALMDEAHMWHRRVAAHAHGLEGIKMAVRAGVNSIEHGSVLDDEACQLMVQKGTYLVPTDFVAGYVSANFAKMGYPQHILNKANEIAKQMQASYQKAVKAGVKIAYGTDAGVFPHGINAKQFRNMAGWGLSPMQVIQSATINAADLLDQRATLGSLEAGKWADIVAVTTDPLKDISTLENIAFVMKDGVVYKNTLAQAKK